MKLVAVRDWSYEPAKGKHYHGVAGKPVPAGLPAAAVKAFRKSGTFIAAEESS